MKIYGTPGDLVFMGPLEVFAGKLTGELHTKAKADDPYGQYIVCHPWSDHLPAIADTLANNPEATILIVTAEELAVVEQALADYRSTPNPPAPTPTPPPHPHQEPETDARSDQR